MVRGFAPIGKMFNPDLYRRVKCGLFKNHILVLFHYSMIEELRLERTKF